MSEHREQLTEHLERDVLVFASPERVWEVVTGPDWLGDDVQLDLVPGGEAQFGTDRSGWVEEASAPILEGNGRLVFWWSNGNEPATRVELVLERQADDTTRLRVAETKPLEFLDVVGMPLPGNGGGMQGPAMLVAA